jgi:cellulose synthase/poly-beta-1,6-N-acetylglucosamine synthase-like glycosyltransferase
MGVSCGIRGNGWCVTHALLKQMPYESFSLVEDVEYGVALGLAGYRVTYCDEATVKGEMVTGERAARSQRQRWEAGRLGLIRGHVPALARAAMGRRSLVCLDLALDLLVLPLSYIAVAVLGIFVVAAVNPDGSRLALTILGLSDLLALVVYVGRGWMLSGVGIVGIWDMLRAPAFLLWKLLVVRLNPKPKTWIRTTRER